MKLNWLEYARTKNLVGNVHVQLTNQKLEIVIHRYLEKQETEYKSFIG